MASYISRPAMCAHSAQTESTSTPGPTTYKGEFAQVSAINDLV